MKNAGHHGPIFQHNAKTLPEANWFARAVAYEAREHTRYTLRRESAPQAFHNVSIAQWLNEPTRLRLHLVVAVPWKSVSKLARSFSYLALRCAALSCSQFICQLHVQITPQHPAVAVSARSLRQLHEPSAPLHFPKKTSAIELNNNAEERLALVRPSHALSWWGWTRDWWRAWPVLEKCRCLGDDGAHYLMQYVWCSHDDLVCCLSGMGDVSQPGVVSPSEQSSCWCVRRGTELLTRNTVAVRCGPATGAGAPHETARILASGHSSQCRPSLRRGAGPVACYIQDTSLCVGVGRNKEKRHQVTCPNKKSAWTA